MRTILTLAAFILAATPAVADPAGVARRASETHVLPGVGGFAAATADLAREVAQACAGPAPRAVFHAAYDAWMAVAHLRLGPLERDNRAFAIAFWPDDRGATGRALARLVRDRDPVADDPAAYAGQPVSARGLTALERLLFEPVGGVEEARYRCRLATTVAADLAATAGAVARDWAAEADGFAADGQAPESVRALMRALSGGVEMNLERLGRPLGSPGKPAPRRAEAWRSARSLRNVSLSLAALRDLAETAFGPDMSAEQAATLAAAFDAAEAAVVRIGAPLPESVEAPQGRARVENALGAVRRLRAAVDATAGAATGAPAGFNALDGD